MSHCSGHWGGGGYGPVRLTEWLLDRLTSPGWGLRLNPRRVGGAVGRPDATQRRPQVVTSGTITAMPCMEWHSSVQYCWLFENSSRMCCLLSKWPIVPFMGGRWVASTRWNWSLQKGGHASAHHLLHMSCYIFVHLFHHFSEMSKVQWADNKI